MSKTIDNVVHINFMFPNDPPIPSPIDEPEEYAKHEEKLDEESVRICLSRNYSNSFINQNNKRYCSIGKTFLKIKPPECPYRMDKKIMVKDEYHEQEYWECDAKFDPNGHVNEPGMMLRFKLMK